MRQDPSDVRVTMQRARKRQIEHCSRCVGEKLKESCGKFQSELPARRMNVWMDEHDRFAAIDFLHELFELWIAEETVSHAAHEHESVTLQCIQSISGFSNSIIRGWKRNAGENPEPVWIFAN